MSEPSSDSPPSLSDRVREVFELLLPQSGWESRPAQLEMALAVAACLEQGERLIVEAGTGTGKSLAYLVPLWLDESSGGPAIIATKTLQLQEQLVRKELPLLQSLFSSPKRVVQARGWSNYLCLRKLDTPSEALVRQAGPELSALRLRAQERHGRLTRQEAASSPAVWSLVQADPLDCTRQHCAAFSRCGLFAERRELEAAELIVTNHAFLMSDLKLRREGGSLLPRGRVLVLDEAHRLDETATEHLSIRIDRERLEQCLVRPRQGWTEAIRFALLARLAESDLLDWNARFDQEIVLALQTLELTAEELLQELTSLGHPTHSPQPAHPWLTTLEGERLANLASELAFGLESMAEKIQQLHRDYEGATESSLPDLERLSTSVGHLGSELTFLLSGDHEGWIYLLESQPPALVARPIDSSETLHRELFSPFASVVVTSATLLVNRSFHFFYQRSGLDQGPTKELALDSPFDWPSSTFLGLSDRGPEPNDADFVSSLAPDLARLMVGLDGRTFLLTTSHHSLRRFAEQLHLPLADHGIELLVQGQAPATQLLSRFASPGARVLLGVDTFWEGVDVPGERLSCVILTRVPFPVPTEPLFAARCQQLERTGGRPFEELSLPIAALKLKQGFGRLLRTASDRGIFLLFDPRAGKRAYGRTLLRHLPAASTYRGSAQEVVTQALLWAERNLPSCASGPSAYCSPPPSS